MWSSTGKRIITDAEIPGITGGALDSREGELGPLYLQGDHNGRPVPQYHDHTRVADDTRHGGGHNQKRKYTPPTTFVRSDDPDPLNVFNPEIAGPLSDESCVVLVLNTALGMVGVTRTTVGEPFATDGVASINTSLAPPPTLARTSKRTPHRGEAT